MFNRNGFKDYQSMNCICKNDNGAELWLGDYYAATDTDLLTKKNIKAGSIMMKYSSDSSSSFRYFLFA